MDIEGAELDALEGMSQLLRKQDVRIIMEFSLNRLASTDKGADGLLDKLAQLGFGVQIIGEKEGLKPFDMAEIVKRSEQSKVSGVNVLCTLERG